MATAQTAERDARAYPANTHFPQAAQRYRDEAAAVLQRLRATWTLPRKELLVSRQLKDAEEALQKAISKREAAAQHLQEAQKLLQTTEHAEEQATNHVTELRVELETAQ